VTYYPALLAPEREEVFSCALDRAELATAAVVGPALTVWVRVVQLLDGRRHREPVRAELTGALGAVPTTSGRDADWLASTLAAHGARVMVTLWGAGREVRELTFSRRFERVPDSGDGIWCRFGVEVASADLALGLVRRMAGR
jgi:hypothetical protein